MIKLLIISVCTLLTTGISSTKQKYILLKNAVAHIGNGEVIKKSFIFN